jgi:hypothetical protein
MLLPTGAHPLMDPFTETRLWPHEHKEIYNLYNRIFDCRGHGWSNLQSTHLNLPFSGDAEFKKLHAAIRLLLPLIPALSASTPLLDGKNALAFWICGWKPTATIRNGYPSLPARLYLSGSIPNRPIAITSLPPFAGRLLPMIRRILWTSTS